MSLGMYPDYVKADPGFTRELLYMIRQKCKNGAPLDDEERAYLVDAITRLGNGLPPARAFYLVGKPSAPRRRMGSRNIDIYNRVVTLHERGSTLVDAYLKVSREALGAKRGGKGQLSPDAIKKIHLLVKRLTRPKGKNRTVD